MDILELGAIGELVGGGMTRDESLQELQLYL